MWHCHSELCRVVLPLLLVEIFRHLSKWLLNKIVPARLDKSALTYYLSWTCVCFCFIPLSDIWFLKSSVSCMHHLALVLLVVITWRNTQSLQQNSIGGSWGVTIRLCCSCVECYDVTSHSPWVKLRSDIIPSSLWIFLHPIQKYSIGWILKQAT